MFRNARCLTSQRTRSPLVVAAFVWLSINGQARAQVVPPTAMNDMTMTSSTSPVTLNVLANDYAGTYPIDSTSVEIVTPPAQGSASVNPGTGAITSFDATGCGATECDPVGLLLTGEAAADLIVANGRLFSTHTTEPLFGTSTTTAYAPG